VTKRQHPECLYLGMNVSLFLLCCGFDAQLLWPRLDQLATAGQSLLFLCST